MSKRKLARRPDDRRRPPVPVFSLVDPDTGVEDRYQAGPTMQAMFAGRTVLETDFQWEREQTKPWIDQTIQRMAVELPWLDTGDSRNHALQTIDLAADVLRTGYGFSPEDAERWAKQTRRRFASGNLFEPTAGGEES